MFKVVSLFLLVLGATVFAADIEEEDHVLVLTAVSLSGFIYLFNSFSGELQGCRE
jgi:hypothetical protein